MEVLPRGSRRRKRRQHTGSGKLEKFTRPKRLRKLTRPRRLRKLTRPRRLRKLLRVNKILETDQTQNALLGEFM